MREAKLNLVLSLLLFILALGLAACDAELSEETGLPSATPTFPIDTPELETVDATTD